MNWYAEATEGDTPTPLCGACRLVPISHLFLDVAEPLEGWLEFFRKRGIEVADDHLGRPSVPRFVLGDLLDEHKEREARLAESAQKRAEQQSVSPARGVPAISEDASALETMMSGPGYTSVAAEYGRPKPDFLGEELAAGKRHAADQAEAVRRAKENLAGREKNQ